MPTSGAAREPYLCLEAPDCKAVIDFLGKYGVTIKATVEINPKTKKHEVYVIVTACDDRATILGEISAEIPKADERR
jgi:hypothetical protein